MDIEEIINIAKKRGFIFPSSEIYGGLAGFFDYGHYGFLMKRNVEDSWIKFFVTCRDDVVLIDGAIITHPSVWKASGHETSFNDPLVECKKCHKRFRADALVESKLNISVDGLSQDHIQDLMVKHNIVCPECKGELTLIKMFNLMFKTHVGSTEDETSLAYLRPETAQLIFTDFKHMSSVSRKKLPFGIAQIGKAFRNEIAPRNFVFRCREFSQMELEYFIHPKSIHKCPYLKKEHLDYEVAALTEEMQNKKQNHQKMKIGELVKNKTIKTEWHAYWIVESMEWMESIGIRKENMRIRQHTKTELSHYALETWDIEYNYPWGWKELLGLANRTDFDLKQHMKFSKEDLTYFDQESKEKVIPYVIEPSFGLERTILTLLIDAYTEKKEKDETKVVLKLKPKIAPVLFGVFPLMKKDGLDEKAKEIFNSLKQCFVCEYDDSGSIGKRYARSDEAGFPFAVTVDYQTLQDQTVTLRDRDTTKQTRVKIEDLGRVVNQLLNEDIKLF
ncbi:MAG TPA: glycine--tRNA ligase [archaeon]|nr:glycine--tRNA ligase [archaeon]